MFDLKEKVALITGASGGIGQAISQVLHQQGAYVVLTGTRQEVLNEFAKNFNERVLVLPANLKNKDTADHLITSIEDKLGKLDILVNNAGLTRDTLALRLKDEDWQEVIDVNLTATFKLIRSSLKGMIKRRWGRIINITSIVGVMGNAGQANYAASKAGLIGMSKSLAAETASRNITVNCIAPGFIETAMTDKLSLEQKQKLLLTIPQGKIGHAMDVAYSAVFLASEEASYITGQTIHVNGGMVMI
ncbi:MAG: 3-oxoacyl-[acyl-carrier-protein] reductase [Alphaproteobacteria bacterium]|nr:3-oxoacyl-[acyl-carrier-protein] reductase [Alphaproteobacteria bacterium]